MAGGGGGGGAESMLIKNSNGGGGGVTLTSSRKDWAEFCWCISRSQMSSYYNGNHSK